MMGQRLAPRVEHRGETNLSAEMPGIAGNGLERLGRSLEQKAIVGRELARQLRGLITVARAKDDVSFPARCSRLLGQFPYGAERF